MSIPEPPIRESLLGVLHRQPALMLCSAFATGIVLDRYWPSLCVVPNPIRGTPGPMVWLGVSSWFLGCWLVFRVRRADIFASVMLLLSVSASGGAWHHFHWSVFRANDVGWSASQDAAPICLEVVALDAARWKRAPPANPLRTIPVGDRTEVTVAVLRARKGRSWRTASGRSTLVIDGHLPEIWPGDRLRVLAVLTAPGPPANEGDFDFAAFQRFDRKLCRLRAPCPECVEVLERRRFPGPMEMVARLREACAAQLRRYLTPRGAPLAGAILLGMREQLERERTEEFFTTGTIHVLAVSGLHVGILAYGFWLVAGTLPFSRRTILIIAIVLVAVYALLTGARPPVVRATVIVVIVCIARLSGRQPFAFNTLAVCLFVVLCMNPTNLFRAGTQLSFLAVATLSVVGQVSWTTDRNDPLDRLIRESRPRVVRWLLGAFESTFQFCFLATAIWMVALPLVMYRFHVISPVALILNPIVWVPMGLALLSGFGVVLFGSILPPLATVLGWICDANLFAIEQCVDWALSIEGNHAWVAAPRPWWVLGFYALLTTCAILPRHKIVTKLLTGTSLAWLLAGTALLCGPHWRSHSGELRCTFIAVGHGTGVLLELPDGTTLLYDAGRLGDPSAAARPIAATLWNRGIRRLDGLIISHADADHYNAIPELVRRFRVGKVLVSPRMFVESSEALSALRSALEEKAIPLVTVSAGDLVETASDVEMEVLHPPPDGVPGSDNANSIVLRIRYSGRDLLLPGDLEAAGMRRLLQLPPLDCDVVMAPHHGSRHSEPSAFVDWSRPEWVIICAGRGEESRASIEGFRAFGTRVAHTGYDGAVELVIRNGRYSVTSYRNASSLISARSPAR